MEEVITFYCKSRNISYTEDNGWIELIAPFVAMGTTKADLFNCLYVLLAKYIPRYVCLLVCMFIYLMSLAIVELEDDPLIYFVYYYYIMILNFVLY